MAAVRTHTVLHGTVEVLECPGADTGLFVHGDIGGIEGAEGRVKLHTSRVRLATVRRMTGGAVAGPGQIAALFHRSVGMADIPGRLRINRKQPHGKRGQSHKNRQDGKDCVSSHIIPMSPVRGQLYKYINRDAVPIETRQAEMKLKRPGNCLFYHSFPCRPSQAVPARQWTDLRISLTMSRKINHLLRREECRG